MLSLLPLSSLLRFRDAPVDERILAPCDADTVQWRT